MSQVIPFLAPRFDGLRFKDHSIPLDVLKDFAALEEMIVETAKWCYLQKHPERKRIPRGFMDEIILSLSGIGEGSAIPVVNLVIMAQLLLPPIAQPYFEEARTRLIGAIDAAEYGEPIAPHLPDTLLSYFNRIGRSLLDEETIEFAPDELERKARLTHATRRKLVLASSQLQEFTDRVILRGSIPEADQEKMTFTMQIINGHRIAAPLTDQNRHAVLEAFNSYRQGQRVLVQGIGRFDRSDRIQGLESIEHLNMLDPRDIAARLEEFKALQPGWLDGKGVALNSERLDWLSHAFQKNYADDQLPLPCLYPTPEGRVQAEWSVANWESSLEVDLVTYRGEWNAVNLDTDEEINRLLQLKDNNDWCWLAQEITKQAEVVA